MNFWKSLQEELGHIRFWVGLSFGFFMILVATLIEGSLVGQPTTAPTFTFWYKSASVFASLFRELGFASLIALAIAVFVEHESRKRQEDVVKQLLERVSKDVFEAVLGNQLPKELVKETFLSILDAETIRESHRTNLVFDDIIKGDGTTCAEHLRIQVTNLYSLKNTTNKKLYNVPVRVGFSKSDHLEYGTHVTLEYVIIGVETLNSQRIDDGYNDIDDLEDMFRYRWHIDLDAGETVSVKTSYVLVKERSDNDIWRSLLPTLSLNFDITMNCHNMLFGAHALHRLGIEKTSGVGARGFHSWRVPAPVLPHQSVIVWWKPIVPDVPDEKSLVSDA